MLYFLYLKTDYCLWVKCLNYHILFLEGRLILFEHFPLPSYVEYHQWNIRHCPSYFTLQIADCSYFNNNRCKHIHKHSSIFISSCKLRYTSSIAKATTNNVRILLFDTIAHKLFFCTYRLSHRFDEITNSRT